MSLFNHFFRTESSVPLEFEVANLEQSFYAGDRVLFCTRGGAFYAEVIEVDMDNPDTLDYSSDAWVHIRYETRDGKVLNAWIGDSCLRLLEVQ